MADFALARAEGRPIAASEPLQRAVDTVAHEHEPITLGRAHDLADSFSQTIGRAAEGCDISGDARRVTPLSSGSVIVVRSADPAAAIAEITAHRAITAVHLRTSRRAVVQFRGYEVDVRAVPPDEYGSTLFITTGPAEHVAAVLRRRGPRISTTEHDLYAQAGLHYIIPELRDAPDAVERYGLRDEAAGVIKGSDIRGDLHMHTFYSDGRDSIEQMATTCSALGYEYIAITDHSQHSAASRTVDPDELIRQSGEIAEVQERFPHLRIFHGIEVDILPDGRLDCPDAILERLDIVLASLHDRAGHDGRRLTARCLQAIAHPLVSIITHPSNQLVGKHPGYEMDYDAIYAAAAESGTVLEIDGAPSHLDLDGSRARQAVAAGVTVSIDSDCHRASALARQMRLGVGTARRAAVTPSAVLNTRPLGELKAFLARKRRLPDTLRS